MGSTAELIQFDKNEIAAFSEFRSQLAQLKHDNEKAVFNYDDPKGNKEARSHVYKLRQTKSAVEKVRKEQKAEALDYGRKVDSQAKEISSEIDSMIDVHEAPLKAIEEKEAGRIQAHKDSIESMCVALTGDESSAEIAELLQGLEAITIDDNYEEFKAEALLVKTESIEGLKKRLAAQKEMEDQRAELERLRKESEENARIQREQAIAQEAREKAEQQAKAQAEAAKREHEEAEERLKQQAEQAERQAKEAEQRAKDAEAKAQRDIKEAAERSERERAELARAEQAELEKREANKKHRAAINNAAVDALIAGGVDAEQAKAAIILIAKGEIANVKISY